MDNFVRIPKETAECLNKLIAKWKQKKEEDIIESCFCGGIIELAISHCEGSTFATVTRKNARIGYGESYMLRKEVSLPADFDKIFHMIYEIL